MAHALSTGQRPARRRALFGLLDADGWGWASVKAFFWFILLIFLLGYVPDRAYYFTVNRTLDLGILAVSPINICPAENEGLPCPAPVGAIRPWHPAPAELALPAPRTDGTLLQVGTQLLYVGGSDGTVPSADVFVAPIVAGTNYDRWEAGPALPEPRAKAAVVFFNGSVYVIGGIGADGAPTTDTFILTPDTESGDLGTWSTAAELDLPLELPAPRAGSAVVELPNGLLLIGGTDGQAATDTSWMAALDGELLGEWTPTRAQLPVAVTDAVAVISGNYVWAYGGTDASGNPTGAVQRGRIGGPIPGEQARTEPAVAAAGPLTAALLAAAVEEPDENEGELTSWGVRTVGNLPEARTNAAGFEANGALYLIGGSDGTRPRGEVYFAVPADGGAELGDIINEWRHLPDHLDLPSQGLVGGSAIASAVAFVVGGTTTDGVTPGAARASLAPQEPLFRLGLVGATIPALQIQGEVGQQIGYLNAMGVGMTNFAIIVVIGVAFANKDKTRALFQRFRRRRR